MNRGMQNACADPCARYRPSPNQEPLRSGVPLFGKAGVQPKPLESALGVDPKAVAVDGHASLRSDELNAVCSGTEGVRVTNDSLANVRPTTSRRSFGIEAAILFCGLIARVKLELGGFAASILSALIKLLKMRSHRTPKIGQTCFRD